MKNINHNDTTTQRKHNAAVLCVVVSLWFAPFKCEATPYEYAPAPCDFTITFPEKPFIEQKCNPARQRVCQDIVTYTQTDANSSLNFRVTCDSHDADKLALLKPEDLKTTLFTLVKEAGLTPYASDSAILEGTIKTSVAMATGKRAGRDIIYIGQMWAGKASVLTVEGQMFGPSNKKIETAYTGILQSIKSKSPALGPALKKTP